MKQIEHLVRERATQVNGQWIPTDYKSLTEARAANPREYPNHFRIATGERTGIIVSDFPITHKTRFTELGYWNVPAAPGEGPSFWQCVDLTGDKPSQVGTQYATKAELLANLEAYATEYGCENANPRPAAPPVNTSYEKALRDIVSLYPEPGVCAELVPSYVGPNDGQMRASTLWYALNSARQALGLPTYPKPDHWSKK